MLPLLLLLLLAAHALAAPFPSSTASLLSFSTQPFLKFNDDGQFDSLAQPIGTVAFMPMLHACGTLAIYSVEPELEWEDFGRIEELSKEGNATEGGLWSMYEEAKTKGRDEKAVEGTILAWARGWRATCGKGAENKEVRVTKLLVDGADAKADRDSWLRSLDDHLAPHLSSLPPAPHNNVVFVTSLSPSSLLTLFDLATPSTPAPSNPKSPSSPSPIPRRRSKGLIHALFSFFLRTLLACALVCAALRLWSAYQSRKPRAEGGVRLPLEGETSASAARELEFELEGESDEDAQELGTGLERGIEALRRGEGGGSRRDGGSLFLARAQVVD
ncbi:hypothetical protein JCM10207_009250 [Rhodosporidiobolus poonsookiae]